MSCTSQLRRIVVLGMAFGMTHPTSKQSSKPEAAFWVSKMDPKPRDAQWHPQLVPGGGVVFEHSFGPPRLVKIQVPKPCSDQCSDQCTDAQMSADAPINVCGCVCLCGCWCVCSVCVGVCVCVCVCGCVFCVCLQMFRSVQMPRSMLRAVLRSVHRC